MLHTFEAERGLQEAVASSRQGPNVWSGLQRHAVPLTGSDVGRIEAEAEDEDVVGVLLVLVEPRVTVVAVIVVTVGVHKLQAARHATANSW